MCVSIQPTETGLTFIINDIYVSLGSQSLRLDSDVFIGIAPYIPPIDPQNASDTQNFDETFLDMEPVIQDDQELAEESDRSGDRTDTDKTDGEDSVQTPAQSRSPSVQPVVEEDVDLFDGYSFKGRHSVLIDEEDEEAEVEEEEEGEEGEEEGEADTLDEAQASSDVASVPSSTVEDGEESIPKTPEARKPALPDVGQTQDVIVEPVAPATPAEVPLPEDVPPVVPSKATSPPSLDVTPKVDKELPHPKTPDHLTKEMPPLPPSPLEEVAKAPAPAPTKSNIMSRQRGRREKSGIAALDKYLSDGGADEDVDQDEDDDWDLVEAPGGEERNGAKGTSYFARGVVDRYRLAVFRKASTPGKNITQRNFSGMSQRSDISTATAMTPSPSPSEKQQRRGRNPALTFRRNPKQFLRNRSPVPPPSSFSGASGRTLVHSTTMSSSVSSNGLITPSPSTHTSVAGPSLKSKESTISMGSPSSDDQSINEDNLASSRSAGDLSTAVGHPESPSQVDVGTAKRKVKKLKKYKEGAEKVLSLFASPRP